MPPKVDILSPEQADTSTGTVPLGLGFIMKGSSNLLCYSVYRLSLYFYNPCPCVNTKTIVQVV